MREGFCECCRRMFEDCRVLREFRMLKTAEGRKQVLAEYLAKCEARGPSFWEEHHARQSGGRRVAEEVSARHQAQDSEAAHP